MKLSDLTSIVGTLFYTHTHTCIFFHPSSLSSLPLRLCYVHTMWLDAFISKVRHSLTCLPSCFSISPCFSFHRIQWMLFECVVSLYLQPSLSLCHFMFSTETLHFWTIQKPVLGRCCLRLLPLLSALLPSFSILSFSRDLINSSQHTHAHTQAHTLLG